MRVRIPEAFKFLFEPHRYKVAYGGRGSGKSWSFATALILRALEKKVLVVCAREIQRSISDSVHRLLVDTINRLGVSKEFVVLERKIVCKGTGSEFIFEGLYRNVSRIKSLEGADICWVEEAENVSEDSWNLLIPTIRKAGSEIWVTFNTRYPDDATYRWFVVNTPSDAVVRKINFTENPFFPEVLRKELEEDKKYRPSVVANKWYGEPIGYGAKVWPEFISEEYPRGHIREFNIWEIKDKSKFFMAMDPALHYYPACIWVALIPVDDSYERFYKWVYAEYPSRVDVGSYFHEIRRSLPYTGTLANLAKEFYVKEGFSEYGIRVEKRYIDTRFVKGSGSASYFHPSTTGLLSEFAKKENGGLVFECPSEKMIDIAKDSVRRDLQFNILLPVNENNTPYLFIAPWCQNMIYSLSNHRLEDGSEREHEKYKDFADALRIMYAGLNGYVFSRPNFGDYFGGYDHYFDYRRETAWMAY